MRPTDAIRQMQDARFFRPDGKCIAALDRKLGRIYAEKTTWIINRHGEAEEVYLDPCVLVVDGVPWAAFNHTYHAFKCAERLGVLDRSEVSYESVGDFHEKIITEGVIRYQRKETK